MNISSLLTDLNIEYYVIKVNALYSLDFFSINYFKNHNDHTNTHSSFYYGYNM